MMASFYSQYPFILSEAAICERLRQIDGVELHPTLFDAPLIYDSVASRVLAGIYRQYIDIAREYQVPILIAAPTWRLDAMRVAEADVPASINSDAVDFIRDVKSESGYDSVLIAGLLAPKNDCYDARVALSAKDARLFHAKQADELAAKRVDCLIAQTIPSVSEAEGMARAMLATGIPSVISFCIDRRGRVLEGTSLSDAMDCLDQRLDKKLFGYKVNCSHPSFVRTALRDLHCLSRLIGVHANASSKDHKELEGMEQTAEDSLEDWVDMMVRFNVDDGVKILGGCCGTDDRYLRALCEARLKAIKMNFTD